jgi:hypothetical protein
MNTEDPVWIVSDPVVFVHPNGDRVAGRIAVGMPVQIDETEARCKIALDGLDCINPRIGGATPLHALLLGVQFIGMRLHSFRSKGGSVLTSDGEAVNLEAMFGPLLQPAVVPKADGDE